MAATPTTSKELELLDAVVDQITPPLRNSAHDDEDVAVELLLQNHLQQDSQGK